MRSPVSIGAVVALVAAGAFATSVGHDFVYDDVHMIVASTQLHSLSNMGAVVTGSWWFGELYRPVTQLSFAVDWRISDADPRYFHVVNILLHAITATLVFLLSRAVLNGFAAAAAGLLFAVHPVHVEAVANVVGRAEVLATLFVLAAALLYKVDGDLASRTPSSPVRWVTSLGVLLLLVLAFGSKETALAAPGLLLIVDWIQARGTGVAPSERIQGHLTLLLASFALAVEWMLLRSFILGDFTGVHPGPGVFTHDFVDRVIVMAPVVVEWLRLMVFPLHLSADYSPNFLSGVPELSAKALVGAAILLSLVVAGVRARIRAPEVTFGLLWLGGTLLVTSNILVPSGLLLAERSLYLPSVGFVLVAGWVFGRLAVKNRNVSAALVALVVAAGLARTVHRVPVWKNATTFFPQLVRDAPGSFRGMWVAGAIAYQTDDRQIGEQLMRSAIATYPLFPNVWSDLASHFEEDERWLEAAQFYGAAFRIDSTRLTDAVRSIANFVKAEVLDSAETVANAAIATHGLDYRLLILKGEIAAERGQHLRAMTWRRQVTWSFPEVWQYWYLTADAAVAAEYCPEATRSLARARNLNRDFTDVLDVESRLETLRCS